MSRKLSAVLIIAGACILFNIVSCSKSGSDNSGGTSCSGTPGPLFIAVKNLVNTRCVSCHNETITNGGMNFTVECNIVINRARIKVRAIDIGDMPQTGTLSSSDKTIITTWLNAGGAYTN